MAGLIVEVDQPVGRRFMYGKSPTQLSTVLSELLAQARLAVRHDPSTADRWLDQLEWFLRRSQAGYQATGIRRGGLAPWQVSRAKRHIDANIAEHLRTPELAGLVGLSENHFSRAFKISVGCSPHRYIVQRRILHAKALIVETDLSLAQIALDSGLADQAHLSRLFRRFFDTTPSACRRQLCAPAFDEAPAPA